MDITLLKTNLEKAMKSDFYKKKFDGLDTGINSLDDFKKLPLTHPEEVKTLESFDSRLAIPKADIFHIHSSTNQGLWALSRRDYFEMTDFFVPGHNIEGSRCICLVPAIGWTGVTPMMHCLMDKMTFIFLPPSKIPELFAPIMKSMNLDGILALPSTLIAIAGMLKSKGLDPKSFGLKYALVAGEAHSDFATDFIKEAYDVETLLDLYGSADAHLISGGRPNRMDVTSTDVFIEVVDSELIVTTLKKEAMPLIRYSSGDIVEVIESDGDDIKKIRVRGRKKETIPASKGIDGITFPVEIEQVLYSTLGKPVNYEIDLREEKPRIRIETDASDKDKLSSALDDQLGLIVEIETLERGTIPLAKGKVNRIIK